MDMETAGRVARSFPGAVVHGSMGGKGCRVDYTSPDGRYHSVEQEGDVLMDHEYKSEAAFLAWHCDGTAHGYIGSTPIETD